jgi:hypothetical protein
MGKEKCKVCDKEFASVKSLHGHLKAHQLRQAQYYQKYYAKYDKFTGEIIKFKNRDQYFDTEFNSRTSLKGWLEKASDQEAQAYCENFLKERKERKKLIYAPSQIELRSLMFPPLHYFKTKKFSYLNICSSIGLERKYSYKTKIEPQKLQDNHCIYVDTREQKPLSFGVDIEVKKLNFGDYTLNDQSICDNVYVERKNLIDFIGTMSGGFERFQREIERAAVEGAYIAVVVESSYGAATNFNKLPVIRNKVRATPEFIFHRVRDLLQSYKNIQFLFVKNRSESSQIIQKLLSSKGSCRNADLQFLYDTNCL